MIRFTDYANKKFDLLNEHGVFITKEQVETAVKLPDVVEQKGSHVAIQKDDIKVIYTQEGEDIRVVTFFPKKVKKK